MSNGTVIDSFITAVADIRGFIQPIATFFYEILAGLIAGWTRGTFDTTENDLVAGIRLTTMIAIDAKVMCIIECPLMVPVT